jgi:hypothetical protein
MPYLRFLSTMAQGPQPTPTGIAAASPLLVTLDWQTKYQLAATRESSKPGPDTQAIRGRPSCWHHCHNSTTINRNPAKTTGGNNVSQEGED